MKIVYNGRKTGKSYFQQQIKENRQILKESIPNFKKEDFYEIAKIIDNDFIGSLDTFSYDFNNEYYLLNTNKCDNASVIKIYSNGAILIIADDEYGYREIHFDTYKNIIEYIKG